MSKALRSLLSTPAERHIFLIGFFETACPWPARQPLPERYPFPLKKEYHYYMGGRWAGFLALLLTLGLFITLLKEVLI